MRVYPWDILNGDAGAPHFLHLTASSPVPFTSYSGHISPQAGHFFATKGSPTKAPSTGLSTPELDAFDRIFISSTFIAIASPIFAPSTFTGRATSWPPLMFGVIIGPQHPGDVTKTIFPPSVTFPAISTSGPIIPSVSLELYSKFSAFSAINGNLKRTDKTLLPR